MSFPKLNFFSLLSAVLLLALPILFVHAQDENISPKPKVGTAVKFDISPPLRTMKIKLSDEDGKEESESDDERGLPGPVGDTKHDPDPVVQNWMGDGVFSPKALIPPVGASFNGMVNTAGISPADTNGDIGTNHYVQMVNSRFQVFSRTGTSLFGPASINTLFAGFGGPCQTENSGDPVVLYDQLADRWLLTQFTSAGPTYFNCVALSQTSDPTGSYYRWAFTTGSNFPDYPKYGIWSDGYYISTREFVGSGGPFAGAGAYALNRDQMLVGNPAPQVVSFVFAPGAASYRTGDGILPADLDGTTLPPAGSPQYYLGSMDAGGPYAAPADALNLFKFQVNWRTPANSTFTFANQINVADFDSIFPCTPTARACIGQPGTTNKLDILSYRQRPLFRLAYRNFGSYESLVTNQSVEATVGLAGIRWWEIRSPNASPAIFQEGTYAPDAVNRWMGSLAMDRQGNMGLGFSAADAAVVFPGVRFTGRLVGDPLGTMPQGEGTIVDGAGSQTGGGNRWGDYSAMTVDPTDDCTFWFTTQYYPLTSSATWNTRIGSFKFPGCSNVAPQGYLVSGRVTRSNGRAMANLNITIQSTAGGEIRYSRTNSNGYYRFNNVLSGQNYIVSVIGRRYNFTSRAIFVSSANLSDIDFMSTNLVAAISKKR